MALTENGSENGMVMPVAPMYGGGNNGGFGDMNNSGWWIILLFILLGNNNWNNGNWGGNGGGSNEMQRGFDQAALTSSLASLQNSVTTGFGDVQNALCNGFNQAEIANNARQMADMQQMFNLQQQLSTCCCNQQSGIESLRATIASENCADRQAVADGVQRILDQMCADKIDSKNEKIADLERQLTMANFSASQTAQTAAIQRGQVAEVDALYQRLRDCPVPTQPVYGSQPIFTCPVNVANSGCGCGCNGGF